MNDAHLPYLSLKAFDVSGPHTSEVGENLFHLEIHARAHRPREGPSHFVLAATPQDFLDMASRILNKMDPVTNEQILVRLRQILEDRM